MDNTEISLDYVKLFEEKYYLDNDWMITCDNYWDSTIPHCCMVMIINYKANYSKMAELFLLLH